MNDVPEATPDPLLLNVADWSVLPAVVADVALVALVAVVALATVPDTLAPATEFAT